MRVKTVLLQSLARPNLKVSSSLQLKQLAILSIGMQQYILQTLKACCDKQ